MASQASPVTPPISSQASTSAGRDIATGPFGQLVGIITRPADTFRRMRETGRGFWWLVVALNIAGLALTAAASARSAGGATPLNSIGASLAGSVALMIADLVLRTLVASGMSLVLGGKASFKQSFRVSLWTSVPFVLRCVVQSAAMFATGGQSVSGMSGVMTPAESAAFPLISTMLGAIDFYMLWSAILLAIGVSVTASLSKGKGIATTLVYLALALGGILALRAISAALTSALSSTLGTSSSINLPGVSGGGPSGGPGGAPPGQ